jgi:hypothetical protein
MAYHWFRNNYSLSGDALRKAIKRDCNTPRPRTGEYPTYPNTKQHQPPLIKWATHLNTLTRSEMGRRMEATHRELASILERSRTPYGMIASRPTAPWGSATPLKVPDAVPSAGTTKPGDGKDCVIVATTVPLSPALAAMLSSVSSTGRGFWTIRL